MNNLTINPQYKAYLNKISPVSQPRVTGFNNCHVIAEDHVGTDGTCTLIDSILLILRTVNPEPGHFSSLRDNKANLQKSKLQQGDITRRSGESSLGRYVQTSQEC